MMVLARLHGVDLKHEFSRMTDDLGARSLPVAAVRRASRCADSGYVRGSTVECRPCAAVPSVGLRLTARVNHPGHTSCGLVT